ASGAGFAASQPTDGGDNYWTNKATQVATGAGVGAVAGAAAEKLGAAKPVEPPTTADLKSAAKKAYKTAEDQGVVIEPNSFKSMATDIRAEAEKAGLDENLTPKSNAVLKRFDKEVEPGTPISLEKAETLRRVAGSALDTPDANDRRIAHIIID